MAYSIVPLLMADPSIPASARRALSRVQHASDARSTERRRAYAAELLTSTLGLECDDARELVDLPSRGFGTRT
jgi:hypothetical protein